MFQKAQALDREPGTEAWAPGSRGLHVPTSYHTRARLANDCGSGCPPEVQVQSIALTQKKEFPGAPGSHLLGSSAPFRLLFPGIKNTSVGLER